MSESDHRSAPAVVAYTLSFLPMVVVGLLARFDQWAWVVAVILVLPLVLGALAWWDAGRQRK